MYGHSRKYTRKEKKKRQLLFMVKLWKDIINSEPRLFRIRGMVAFFSYQCRF